jgi:NAD(P)-dependent dehydrogenase (short-subunit alcohol dehydrogenase family)
LIQLTRYAASFLGSRGVRVNAVSPGGFLYDQDPRMVARYTARTFLGRMAGEEDLGGVIVFLASDASAYITGANIPVDGGYTAK